MLQYVICLDPDNPVELLSEQLSLLVGYIVPTKVLRVRNKNKPWFNDDCRNAFNIKQEANLIPVKKTGWNG